MSAESNAPNIIIKRVKKVSGGGHHGGAWKVAYADFVTAMMAFFMLMWLLNATTETQRKGLADYFSPTIPITRASGGGNGAFGGDSVFVEETLAQMGHGGTPVPTTEAASGTPSEAEQAAEAQALEALEEMLSGRSGESMVSDLQQRHIVTEVTDEGLVIEVYDTENEPLFAADGTTPEPILVELVDMLVEVFSLVKNGVAIEGHVASAPVVLAENKGWDLSADRAGVLRALLEEGGLDSARVQRVSGHADRDHAARNPMAVRNNRIELILLRSRR